MPGQHVVDDPEVDVAGDRAPLGPLEVDLGDAVVLDHGDALLADVDRDQQLALGGGQRRPARRLTASLGAAALSGASPVGGPLGPLAPLGLLPRGLLGRLLVGRAARLGALLRPPAACGRDRHDCRGAACFSAPRLRHRSRSGSAVCACLRDVRLSRGGRSFCCCALGRVLLVLLVLPSKPGQRVPLLVVARAGTRHPHRDTGLAQRMSKTMAIFSWASLALAGVSVRTLQRHAATGRRARRTDGSHGASRPPARAKRAGRPARARTARRR